MKTKFEEFKEKYPAIKIDEESYTRRLFIDDGSGPVPYQEEEKNKYTIKGIKGLDGVTGLEDFEFVLYEETDFDALDNILESGLIFFNDFLGMACGSVVEVPLSNLGRGPIRRNRHDQKDLVEVNINYHNNQLSIKLMLLELEETKVGALSSTILDLRLPNRLPVVTIEGLEKPTSAGLESDIRNVLNSVLFDIQCTYGMTLGTTNIEKYKFRRRATRRLTPLPSQPINLLYKNYIPELLEYHHTADSVDYLPFKYICYFHVVEYFMDKSAYELVSKRVKQILMRPDFHLKSNAYIAEAVNIFKKENERYTSDKNKINRVFQQFIDRDSIKKFISDNNLASQFEIEKTIICSKPLKLPAINFENDNNFFDTLTRRIYSLRCSIVHSNPDFDENKAVPFSPTIENIDFLREEIDLIKEISKTIIIHSVQQ